MNKSASTGSAPAATPPPTAPDTPERRDYLQTVLTGRLIYALQKINPHIPLATLEEAAQAVTKTESPVLIHINRAFCERLSGKLAPSAAETETADAI